MVLLLAIIYLAFISLGLPDSLLGSAWPSMFEGLGVSIDRAGIISMIMSGSTICSSFMSVRLIRRFGTCVVMLVSVTMTAIALLGFSFAHHFILLCILAIPLGFGGGSVDAALNNFVAVHYQAKHMSWLHCFWGVGASLGPIVMSFCLVNLHSWNAGYRVVSMIQFSLVAILLMSIPLWKKVQSQENKSEKTDQQVLTIQELIRLPGAMQALMTFFAYCAIEATVGLWGSTYLVTIRGIDAVTAARWISFYFFGITLGRFLSGFLAMKLHHKQMVQLGLLLIGVGIAVLFLPVRGAFILAGLFLIGLGLAPIFPSLIHESPINFGIQYSQSMIGAQIGFANLGVTFMPPLFGLLGAKMSYGLLPVFLGFFLLFMVFMVMQLYQKTTRAVKINKMNT